MQIQKWNNKKGSWGTVCNLHHFRGKEGCQSSEMGIRMNDKRVNYLHKHAQTKQQVG
jgi:hypothetical protein